MIKSIAIHKLQDYSAAQIATLQSRTEDDLGPYMDAVRPVIDAVRDKGDAALVHYAKAFDNADPKERVSSSSSSPAPDLFFNFDSIISSSCFFCAAAASCCIRASLAIAD